jgi:hypothetical protein
MDDTAITQTGVDLAGRVSKFTQRIICRFRLIEAEIISVMWLGDTIPKDTTMEQWEQQCIDTMAQWRQEIYALAHANKDPGLVQRWKEMALYSDIAYPYILVTLYRPSRQNPTPSTNQMMVALANAVKVAEGYFQQSEAEAGRIKYVFHPCHHVFNCALVFLQGIQRCKQEVSDAYSWKEVEEWMYVFAKCFSSIAERWAAARRCLEEYDRLLTPIKKEYIEFLNHKVSLHKAPSQFSAGTPEGLYQYPTMGPQPAPADIDEAYNFWSVFNPTTTTDNAEAPSTFVYNQPPRDWNAEFSLTSLGMDSNSNV